MRVYFDELIGRVVKDANGNAVGRIFEVRVQENAGELEIVEYHLGGAAMLERVGLSLLRVMGVDRLTMTKVPWDRLDLSDPKRPLLRSD
ncbi:MAG TPA: hypothetical protein VKH19_18635 [Gemmatimonadaceae bacterium]|nr:hypothetical protein [Gemmatimonadaceae bacterium]